ncbi:MAG: hypothetical protein LBB08_00445 [Rickettsiales bacterium]|nr:hypothetical protein [Rickettsiales bacterium]
MKPLVIPLSAMLVIASGAGVEANPAETRSSIHTSKQREESMNKLVIPITATITLAAGDANAEAYLTMKNDGNYAATRIDRQKKVVKSGWYAGMNGSFNLASWTYNWNDADLAGTDKMSKSQSFGGNGFIGFGGRRWRGDLEFGTRGDLSDTKTFSEEIPGNKFTKGAIYGTINGYFEFAKFSWGGLYVGGGIGIAQVSTAFDGGDKFAVTGSAVSTSPLGQVSLGLETRMSESWSLNLAARGMIYQDNGKVSLKYDDSDGNPQELNISLSDILSVSANLGLKYHF